MATRLSAQESRKEGKGKIDRMYALTMRGRSGPLRHGRRRKKQRSTTEGPNPAEDACAMQLRRLVWETNYS